MLFKKKTYIFAKINYLYMNIDDTIEKIANFFGFSTNEVLGKDNSHKISQARNFIYYILHFDCGCSSATIAKKMCRSTRHIVRQNALTKYQVENFKPSKATYQQVTNNLDF